MKRDTEGSLYKEVYKALYKKGAAKLFQKSPIISDDSHLFLALLRLKPFILQLPDKEFGKQYIDALQTMSKKMDNINFQLYCQECMIEYYDIIDNVAQKQTAIIEYYYLNKKNNKLRKESFCNSLIAKVQLEELLQEQTLILQENKQLKNLSEIDELTQIYNRQTAQKKILEKISENTLIGSAALIILDLDYLILLPINHTYVSSHLAK